MSSIHSVVVVVFIVSGGTVLDTSVHAGVGVNEVGVASVACSTVGERLALQAWVLACMA